MYYNICYHAYDIYFAYINAGAVLGLQHTYRTTVSWSTGVCIISLSLYIYIYVCIIYMIYMIYGIITYHIQASPI